MKVFLCLSLLLGILTAYPTNQTIYAENDVCLSNTEIKSDEIAKVDFEENGMFIDVVFSEDTSGVYYPMYEVGPCTSEYKYIYRQASRQDLIKMKEDIEAERNLASALIGFLFGQANPIVGSLVGYAVANTSTLTLDAINNALNNSYQLNYTIRCKFHCEQGDMGSRGKVHRYRLVAISIY